MKKKMFIIVLAICLVVFTLFAMYLIDRYRMKNNKPVIFSTWGYLYAPPINLNEVGIENAIIDYITRRGDSENKYHKDSKTFASMRIYLIEEKNNNKLYNIYAWVLEEAYYFENNEIKQDSGSSIPHKFVVQNIDGKYTVTDAIIPRDGSYYPEDMKEIFPFSVRNDMNKVHEDGTIEELQKDIDKQREVYFHR